jgi:hypothetical protein
MKVFHDNSKVNSLSYGKITIKLLWGRVLIKK